MRRCNIGEGTRNELDEEENFEYEFIPKKRKLNGYNSNPMGIYSEFDDFSSGSGSFCSGGSYWASEVQSNSKKRLKKQILVSSRKPISRSSRGRVQILPSRFNDSVVDIWKNEECRIDDTDLEIGDDEFADKDGEFVPRYGYTGLDKLRRERAQKKKDVYRPEDFALGDIVWAKCGKRYPWWPAVVIDPILKAPDAVLSCCVPGALCVMFYGYSKNGTQRDYAWVKRGMIFPFAEFMDRFQVQTQMFRCKLSDFQAALEEAILAESAGMDSISTEIAYPEAYPTRLQEASCSSQDHFYTQQQASFPFLLCLFFLILVDGFEGFM
ncbi:hypothetical protein OIU78_015571 [Salix suchowensis]|nr:hypothetical protein OIU78_015571 [Salix suchowensis]